MDINRVDQAVAAALILVGGYIVWAGFGYGYVRGTTPGPGFFPVIIGGAIALLSVVNLVRSLTGIETLAPGLPRRDLWRISGIVVAIAALIVATPLIGITFAAMGLMLAIGLLIRPSFEPGFLGWLVACSILFPLFCRLAFGVWLKVPLPLGPFGI